MMCISPARVGGLGDVFAVLGQLHCFGPAGHRLMAGDA